MKYLSIIYGNCKNSKHTAINYLEEHGFKKTNYKNLSSQTNQKLYIVDSLTRDQIIDIKKNKEYNYKPIYFINRNASWDFSNNELDIRDELRNNIDTTFATQDNILKIVDLFFKIANWEKPLLIFKSFGFKYGIVQDLDIVFNVRILPNPYWDENLRHISGENQVVVDYVLNTDFSNKYLKNIKSNIDYFLEKSFSRPNGKHSWVFALACTGGMHRSVVSAEWIAKQYHKEYNVIVWHDNLNKIKVI